MAHANVKVIENFAQFWTAQRWEDLANLFTPDATYEDVALGAVNQGRDNLIKFFHATNGAFPDFTVTLHSGVADDARGAAEWTMSGTHVGDFPGLPGSGKPFSVRGTSIMRFENGKIAYNGDYWSVLSFLVQGGLPNPLTGGH